MNRVNHRALLSVVMAIACFVGIASAQASPRVIKAHIPFGFSVGDKQFAAGDYSITEPEQNLLNLRNDQGHTVALMLAHTVETVKTFHQPELKFVPADGGYALLEVWQGNSSSGSQLSRPKSGVTEVKQNTQGTQVVVATY
jgi:hypothetical protein